MLREHIRERTPAAFAKAKTKADLDKEEEEEKRKSAAANPIPRRKGPKVVRISRSKHAGTTASKRGLARRKRVAVENAAAQAATGKKVFAVPKSGSWMPVVRDMSLRFSSSFSLEGWFHILISLDDQAHFMD